MLLRPFLILFISIFCLLSVQSLEIRRSRYRYNHPPSVESVDIAPGEVRESKALKQPAEVETVTTERSPVQKVQQATQEVKSDVVPPAKVEEQKTPERKPAFRRKNVRKNVQIPVNVVYETETSAPRSQQENEDASSRIVQRRKQFRRRLQKPKAEETTETMEKSSDDSLKLKQEDKIVQSTTTSTTPRPSSPETEKVPVKEKIVQTTTTSTTPRPPSPETENARVASVTTVKDEPQVTTERSRFRARTRRPFVPIVTEENFVYSHSGNFHYSFEGADGTKVYEEGKLKSINEDTGEAVQGGYSYTDQEGNDYSLSYTADENGYRPSGAHLPTSPPIPPEIARALAYLATKSTPQPVTESIKNIE